MDDEKFDADKGDFDLGPVLAQLSRPDLELVVVKMIAKFPESIDVLIDLAKKEVNIEEIKSELNSAIETEDEECIVTAWEQYLDRAGHCAIFNNITTSVLILSEVSESFVGWATTKNKDELAENPLIEPFVTKLESVWSQALTQNPQQKHKELLEASFKKLATWRNAITPLLGPLFSDPMRSVKKSIQKLNNPASTSTTSSTSTSTTTADSGAKRTKVSSTASA